MNFLEAVTALKEGKCLGIRRPHWANGSYYKINQMQCNSIVPSQMSMYAPFVTDDIFATDWELVPKPKVKKRIEGWSNIIQSEGGALRRGAIHETEEIAISKRHQSFAFQGKYIGEPLHIVHEYEEEE